MTGSIQTHYHLTVGAVQGNTLPPPTSYYTQGDVTGKHTLAPQVHMSMTAKLRATLLSTGECWRSLMCTLLYGPAGGSSEGRAKQARSRLAKQA